MLIYYVASTLAAIVAVLIAVRAYVKDKHQDIVSRTRHAVVVEANTVATEKLTQKIDTIGDKLAEHDKRLWMLEWGAKHK